MNEVNVVSNENKILSKLNNKISEYLSLKDEFMDDDYLEAFGDSLSIIRCINSTYKLISKKRLAYFLKGLNRENEPSTNQLLKLYDYIDSEEKAEFISDNITKVLISNSKNSCFLLGLMIHRLISSKANITYKELICANALSAFYDFDLDNIVILSEYNKHIKTIRNVHWFDLYNGFKKWCEDEDIHVKKSLNLTVEKCVSFQILIKDIEVDLDIDDDDPSLSSAENSESYKFSEAGELLIDNLKYLEII